MGKRASLKEPQGKAKAKGKAKAAPTTPRPERVSIGAASAVSGRSSPSGLNAPSPMVGRALDVLQSGKVIDAVVEARDHLMGLDAFRDVLQCPPGNIGASHISPFNPEEAIIALSQAGSYMCGANLFWVDLWYNVNPGVPVSSESVQQLIRQFFTTCPPVFPDKISVAIVRPDDPAEKAKLGKLVRVSPEEMMFAFFIGASTHILSNPGNEDLPIDWKKCALATPMEFKAVADVDAMYWLAVNTREVLGTTYSAMYRSAVQRIFEMCQWKERHEKASGLTLAPEAIVDIWKANVSVSAVGEEISYAFADAALTVWNRILSNDKCKQIIIDAENKWGKRTPWDSVYKLEGVVKRCGRPGDIATANITWCLAGVSDMILNDQQPSGFFTVRMISGRGHPGNKGVLDLLIYKKSVKQEAMNYLRDLNVFASDELELVDQYLNNHESYRNKFGYDHTVMQRAWLHRHPKCLQQFIILFGDSGTQMYIYICIYIYV